ncbi:hypothetical protein LWI29_020833 [Acer saccharum]|uniref:C2H2-type domain-containing protein n=1 Tax=Acer saccharum TaxID=4024 RepID=A0AA39TGQ3_ACESA|nr:hypothetical protein LWI29_020833 [Acer saccharum]KAK1592917.1 hypothetical protein Q3G72_032403 [Acer saccharum]
MSNIGETSGNRPGYPDLGSPLTNLSTVRTRMDSLQQFLSESVSSNTLISKNQMDMVSSEISSAIHQIIVNGAALLVSSNSLPPPPQPQACSASDPKNPDTVSDFSEKTKRISETKDDPDDESEYEVVEIDAVELLAEHIHFCDICGKGFKRDANLRMHMRAHGNEYKTAEALAKPEKSVKESGRKTRFSCPFEGCNRNKRHRKFRALKSVTCVKNHFKRSHCPKTYQCDRCHKKSFSVISDLKSHYKHCGESRWKCSCGTSFSRKDKLFGHVALFEGHMPQVDEKMKGVIAIDEDDHDHDHDDDVDEEEGSICIVKNQKEENGLDDKFFEGLLDDFGSIENYCLQDVLGSPNANWNGNFL